MACVTGCQSQSPLVSVTRGLEPRESKKRRVSTGPKATQQQNRRGGRPRGEGARRNQGRREKNPLHSGDAQTRASFRSGVAECQPGGSSPAAEGEQSRQDGNKG